MPACSIQIDVDVDMAVCEMYDIVQDLEEMIDLLPDYCQPEAAKLKTKIINKMVSWIDGKE